MEPLYLLSQVAVNCYVMITGYFLIIKTDYRWSGVVHVVIQTLFYSLVFLLLAVLLKYDYSKTQLLKSFFPIHQWGYWFVTVYVGLLLIAPLLSRIASTLTKRQFQIVLAVLFVMNFQYLYGNVYAGHRTIIFFGFLFLLAGYIKIHGVPQWILNHRTKLFVGIWLCLTILASLVNLEKGNFELIGTAYDGPILFLSVMTFIVFINAKLDGRFCQVIARLAPYTFGVYLIHTNCFVNDHLWSLLPSEYNYPIIVHCVLFCVLLFIICVAIDFIRDCLFKLVRADVLIKRISDKLPQL